MLACGAAAAGRKDAPEQPDAGSWSTPVISVPRATGPVVIDGELSDPPWASAARIDIFYEYNPGDNLPPRVRTLAWLMYDQDALYVAVQADDPHPERIRAPIVERDQVFGDQDNVALFIDTRGDRRVAVQLRVNPRGVQADATVNDATGNEDFSPDFFYDAAARITDKGWNAEFRIPLRSLRFDAGRAAQPWSFFLVRNYPREFRYQISSVRVPRGITCLLCRAATLEGITDLPSSGGLVAAPHVTAQAGSSAPRPGAPLERRALDGEAGLDVKWTPSADTALDAAVNPDFSQVESDVAQIAVNNRFALSYAEKRPFFLESVDLLETPLGAVYTRTVTDPRWGARATGRVGRTAYTLLAAEDAGGGLVVLPRPTSSGLARQDFRSWVGIARARRDLDASFVGLLATAREIQGGGHNHVVGPDFQWRPGQHDALAGQFLWSDTRTPPLPELAAEWDGRRLQAHAAQLEWRHSTPTLDWRAEVADVGHDFRADLGFVPQAGIRQVVGGAGYSFYSAHGVLSRVRPFLAFSHVDERGAGPVERFVQAGANLYGKRSLFGQAWALREKVASGGRLFGVTQVGAYATLSPSRRVPSLTLRGVFGGEVDADNVRAGRGAELSLNALMRPGPHLSLQADSVLRWLDVRGAAGQRERLFTSQVQRLRATFNFTSRTALRLIGQYVGTSRDPALYVFDVARRDGALTGSLLFTYRLDWQTALYVGYGDQRALDDAARLRTTSHELFLKVSYALQR